MKPINTKKEKEYYIVEKTIPKIHARNWYDHNIDLKNLGITKEQIVVIVLAGSKMYGTDTEDSDNDYLGIYIPTKEDILLNNVKHHISLKTDTIDLQIWSIYKFLDLACKGETMAIDLLHAPYDNWLIFNAHIWPIFVNNKKLFYTKNMKSFVGYARTQAAIYGIKGNRLKELENVINIIEKYNVFNDLRLKDIWNKLPNGDHIYFLYEEPIALYQVCGRKYQETAKISYVLNGLKKLLTNYGKRAKMAKNNEGVDFKALSHAIRSAEQVYWTLKYGEYKYPLKNNDFIKKIKLGKIDFIMAQAVLEDYINEIEKMIPKSKLPETVNKKMWRKWLIDILKEYLI